MARPDRSAYRATSLDGKTLKPAARLLLRLLWDMVRKEQFFADRDGGPAPEVPFRKDELEQLLDCSSSSLDEYLKALHDSWWIRRKSSEGSLHWVRLLSPERRRNEAPEAVFRSRESTPKRIQIGPDEESDVSSRPRTRAENSGSSPRVLGHRDRELGDDLPSSRAPSILSPLTIKLAGAARDSTGVARERVRARDDLDDGEILLLALEILSDAVPPRGAAPIPPNQHGARFLAAALRSGTVSEMFARRLLVAAPALVEAGLEEPRFYVPRMWDGEMLDHWSSSLARLEQREAERAAEAARVEAELEQRRLEVEELQRHADAVVEEPRPDEDRFEAMARRAREALALLGVPTGGEA